MVIKMTYKAKSQQCIATSWDGTRCEHQSRDSTKLCEPHRRQLKNYLEVEVLHCTDCPVGEKDRCRMFQSDKTDLCFYEVQMMFKVRDKEGTDDEIDWALHKEEVVLKRLIRQNTREGVVDTQVLSRLDRFITNRMEYARYKGYVAPSNKQVLTVESTAERDKILAVLLQKDDKESLQQGVELLEKRTEKNE